MLCQKLSARSHRHENADSRIYGFVVKSINFSFLFHRIELLTKPIGHDEELTILGQLRHPLHLLLDEHLVLLLYTAIWKITMFHCKKSNNVLSKNCPFLLQHHIHHLLKLYFFLLFFLSCETCFTWTRLFFQTQK